MRELLELVVRVNELERRVASMMRHGTVEQVDAAKQLVRVRIGEPDDDGGQPFISPWVPYAQIAGALKVHTPPSAGQQMTLLSPTGDFRQAVAIPLTWSDANQSPSQKGDEHVFTFGNVKGVLTSDGLKITVSDNTVDITGDGTKLTIGDTTVNVTKDGSDHKVGGHEVNITASGTAVTGAKITHDDVPIDKTHLHKDVQPGAGLTGPPNS